MVTSHAQPAGRPRSVHRNGCLRWLLALLVAAGLAPAAHAEAVLDVLLSPALDASACNGGHSAGYDSQILRPDGTGQFDEVWSLTTPVTRVIGYVDETSLHANISCLDGTPVYGTLDATRARGDAAYLGQWSFGAQVGMIEVTPRGAQLFVDDVRLEEGNDGQQQATFTLALTTPADQDITFHVETADLDAQAASDYEATQADLVIPAGELTATFPVTVFGDTDIEDDESFEVVVSNLLGPASVGDGVGYGVIVDDEHPVLSVSDAVLSEGTGATRYMTFYLSLSAPAIEPVTVDVKTVAGSALAGSDFAAADETAFAIPLGARTRSFQVAIVADANVEYDETFGLALSNVAGARLGDAEGVGRIVNDDWPRVSIGDFVLAEGNAGSRSASFTVRLDRAAPWAVGYAAGTANATAIAGSDYAATSATGQLIPPGALARTFLVPVTGDTAIEYDETFRAQLGSVTGALLADAEGVATIVNDDFPVLSIGNVAVAEGDAGTKYATFTARLDRTAPFPVTYDIATADGSATAGSDYVARSLTAQVIPAGALARTFAVTVNGDTAVEADETFTAKISHVTNARAPAAPGVGTVRNDDHPQVSIGDVTVTEGNAGTKLATFKVRLDRASPAPVTYDIATADGTATAGSDYVARSLAGQSIPAGALMRTFEVTVNGDAAVEPDEAFTVTVSGVGGGVLADGQAIGTVQNDDAAAAPATGGR